MEIAGKISKDIKVDCKHKIAGHPSDTESNMSRIYIDSGRIEKIFRIMHSLKGEGSMFGFETISKFTHNLENIYDLIRNKKLKTNSDILDITFESIDVLRNLLSDNQDDENSKNINNRIQSIISSVTETKNDDNNNDKTEIIDIVDNEKIKTYYVTFKPNKDILKSGTNPLFLLDDISSLGDCKVFANFDNIPDINNINPADCYTLWDIFVAS
jgi:two-component system chemotaxis sensor kinase CheA